ncbi:response regulator [Derxia gummosa]|uniref:Response regulator n=1 Tax=Derxia gummosa DSM 723 TaxID=1121388 RepID=A0A8B6X2J7_9BURK|nr:response regulator transcription factor [Derxia gummosa]
MRILLADDHALMRAGLVALLHRYDPNCEVIEAADGRAAIDLARRHTPDICLLDVSMPGLNGIDAIPLLRRASPHTRVLIVSMHTTAQHVSEALREGAVGYLVKDAAAVELFEALKAVAAGRPYVSPQLAALTLAALAQPTPRKVALTGRQREILQLIAEGHSTRDIAERLHLSVKTVETHRAELMRRLDIHDVAGLTRHALREGIISLD